MKAALLNAVVRAKNWCQGRDQVREEQRLFGCSDVFELERRQRAIAREQSK